MLAIGLAGSAYAITTGIHKKLQDIWPAGGEVVLRSALGSGEFIHPELYGNAEMTVLMPPDAMEIAPPESVDMVVTFRNIHNWMPRGSADSIFSAIYRALKPGGVLGVVEHRGNPDVAQDPKAASGYVNQDYAIELAERAGFVLDASSEINANPNDTKDYEPGVWTLPPTLRLKEQDQDRYLAIGESDRFTLRFVKPTA